MNISFSPQFGKTITDDPRTLAGAVARKLASTTTGTTPLPNIQTLWVKPVFVRGQQQGFRLEGSLTSSAASGKPKSREILKKDTVVLLTIPNKHDPVDEQAGIDALAQRIRDGWGSKKTAFLSSM